MDYNINKKWKNIVHREFQDDVNQARQFGSALELELAGSGWILSTNEAILDFRYTRFYKMTSNDDLMVFLLKMEEKRASDSETARQELRDIRVKEREYDKHEIKSERA